MLADLPFKKQPIPGRDGLVGFWLLTTLKGIFLRECYLAGPCQAVCGNW